MRNFRRQVENTEFLNFKSPLGLLIPKILVQRKTRTPEPPVLTPRFLCFRIALVKENQEFLRGTKDVPGNKKLERDWKKMGENVKFSSASEVPEWGQ